VGGRRESKATDWLVDCGNGMILVFKTRQTAGVLMPEDYVEMGESHQENRDGELPAVLQ
jgi:hypothetical protein